MILFRKLDEKLYKFFVLFRIVLLLDGERKKFYAVSVLSCG